MDDIKERLVKHHQAFDALMTLIPANIYYSGDNSDQWRAKKKTKDEAKNARKAKLAPESYKSAQDLMENSTRKRKRDEDNGDEKSEESSDGEIGSELPREGLTRGQYKQKKQKQPEATPNPQAAEERRKLNAEKKAEKKVAQREKKKAKDAAKKAEKNDNVQNASDNNDVEGLEPADGVPMESQDEPSEVISAPSSIRDSPIFDLPNDNSGSSSISSIVPPTDSAVNGQKPALKPLKTTPEELRQRLQKRLDELRAARHADGLNGQPARSRQELIEARRIKADQRKAHKKELRRKAKEEEERKKDEEMQRRFSPGGAGSLLASPRSPVESLSSGTNNFSFGRIAFPDGQHADASLSHLLDDKQRKGPQDPATALKAAESKKERLAGLDAEKRADIEEKDMWLNAKKRAHGERVRDDTSLLKKALKRKESAKRKSEREWKERIDGVAKGKEVRQQRREDNIRKRKEDRSGGGGGGKKGGKGKSKPRPGFEGSFKAKVGGKKK